MTMKRFVAMLLAILMVLQVSPLTAMADGVFYSNTVRGVDVHTVNFMIAESVKEDGTFNYTTVTQYVEPGAKAEEPDVPDIDGYKKAGWDGDVTAAINADVTFTYQYTPIVIRKVTVYFQYADGSMAKPTLAMNMMPR